MILYVNTISPSEVLLLVGRMSESSVIEFYKVDTGDKLYDINNNLCMLILKKVRYDVTYTNDNVIGIVFEALVFRDIGPYEKLKIKNDK